MELKRKIIGEFLDDVQKTPYLCKGIVVDGFAFLVHWDSKGKWFRATMMFTPEWGHTHGVTGRTKDSFFDEMVLEIQESKKIFTNGGKFPEDYYEKCLTNK